MGNNHYSRINQLLYFYLTLVITVILISTLHLETLQLRLRRAPQDSSNPESSLLMQEIPDVEAIDSLVLNGLNENSGKMESFASPLKGVPVENEEIIKLSCSGDGQPIYERNKQDCGSFFVCTGFYYVLFKCPADLHWNPNTLMCDWQHIVNCVENQDDDERVSKVSASETINI